MNYTSANHVIEIENRFEQLFDFFHTTSLRREEYFVALYLLYAFYKKVDLRVSLNNETSFINVNLNDLNSQTLSLDVYQARKLHETFKPTLEKFSFQGLRITTEILSSINHLVLEDHFPEIFDRLLYKLSKSQGRFSGEFILPLELSRFMCNLAELPSNAKVYNPFAGLASFAVFLDGDMEYIGQEINLTTWAIGTLRIMAYEKNNHSQFILGNSLEEWQRLGQFDLIISNPPFGLRLQNQFDSRFGQVRSTEHFLIEHGLDSLKSNGKMILCVSQGFLFRAGSDHKLRQYLIENDLLEIVISLPSGMLLNTSVATAIIVINKDKKVKEEVRFVDATNFVESSSSREKKLNEYKLNSVIENSIDSNVLRIVSNETIAAYDFNFNTPRYFQKEYYGARLRDIGSLIRGKRISEGQKGKFVRIRDLKDDKLDFQLSVDKMDDVALPRHVQCIQESCIIMALRWKTLKPTFFNFTGIPIFLTLDTLAFKVDESKVDPAFLINELNAEYVVEQLNAYRIGETIPAIRREDLLNVKINLPSIEEQRAKVTGILEISSKINQLQAERNALAHGLGQKQFNEFASLKHTLGTPRQNILSYAEALISFFEKNPSTESEKLSADFKERMGVDLNSAFQAIKHDINFISELLEKGENGLQLSDYNLETINLNELEKLVAKVKSASYNYTLEIQPLKSYNKAEQGLICNSTLLKILLDNILMNAHKHGFDSKKQSHEVVIDLSVLDDNLIIDIKNNGKKFPKGFDKEKFIAKYSTANPNSGTGIGGYDINRIIEYFNGTWDLILNEDTIYPVRFRIQFPIKPII